MSSLTEQERIGLEEVFLSISPSQNVFQKWSPLKRKSTLLMKLKRLIAPVSLLRRPYLWIKNPPIKHKITKLLNKIQKRRKI